MVVNPVDGPEAPWMARRLYAMLPQYVPAANVLTAGLQMVPKADLGRYEWAQLNRYGRFLHVDLDMDFEEADSLIRDRSLPEFSWVVHNHRSHHLHVAWLLASPLNDRKRTFRTMRDDLVRRLQATLCADPRHHGRGPNPNPFFAGRNIGISVEWGSSEPVRASEFFEWLPKTVELMDKPQARGSKLTGEGRNVDLFQEVRREAYRAVRHGVQAGWTQAQYAAHVHDLATEGNGRFDTPLPRREVRATARSIARWTWARRRRGLPETRTLAERQADRARARGRKVRERNRKRDGQVRALSGEGMSQKKIVRETGIPRSTVQRILRGGAHLPYSKEILAT